MSEPKKAQIALGARVRDKLTSFTGKVISRTEYLFDEPCYSVVSPELQDGKENRDYFAEGRLEVIG